MYATYSFCHTYSHGLYDKRILIQSTLRVQSIAFIMTPDTIGAGTGGARGAQAPPDYWLIDN